MASALYLLYRIDVRNLVRNKLYICKEYHIQPSEIDKMVFYEYEYMLEDIKDHQKQQESYQESQERQTRDMERMMKNPYGSGFKPPDMSGSGFKMPTMPSMPSMPSFSMPKI